jgi:predicted lipid-binding transport protein (Tim44 family)
MEEKKPAVNQKMKLIYVMVVVFIVCGGNGLGLLMGGLIWRSTGRLGLAIGLMVGITLLAFLLAVCLILVCSRLAAQDEPQKKATPAGEESQTQIIPEEESETRL